MISPSNATIFFSTILLIEIT